MLQSFPDARQREKGVVSVLFLYPPSLSLPIHSSCPRGSISSGARGLVVLAQANQHLPELGLAGTLGTTTDALAAQIDELCYPLPAGAAGGRVLSVLDKLFGVLSRLRHSLVLFVVVIVVKVVDGLLGGLDRLGLAVAGDLVAVGNGHVSALAPFADDVWLLLVLEGSLEAWVDG